MTASIDIQETQRIADLAHLGLSEPELRQMTAEIAKILAYVDELKAVDVTGIEPTAHVQLAPSALRPDEPQPSFTRQVALAEAPQAAPEGFRVPAFMDEG